MTTMDFSNCKFLEKIPDVSRVPNLEKLNLECCVRLVEVHSSVGSLEKLVHLSVASCYNLRTFPRSLKLKSLKSLSFSDCSELKEFPEIECQMECLEFLNCSYSGIEDLPSSVGYLIRLKKLDLYGCKNLMNLPSSIHQLQHLEILFLTCCSKVKFLNKVEDNRQSMPFIVSTDESITSSGSKLFQLSPPAKTRDSSSDGCSSISFPKLQKLLLDNCVLSKSNFFGTFDYRSTLNHLDLSNSDIVTIPPCINRFVGLEILNLKNCKQL
jgi:Leucine-rich repeat (LRR) protein